MEVAALRPRKRWRKINPSARQFPMLIESVVALEIRLLPALAPCAHLLPPFATKLGGQHRSISSSSSCLTRSSLRRALFTSSLCDGLDHAPRRLLAALLRPR